MTTKNIPCPAEEYRGPPVLTIESILEDTLRGDDWKLLKSVAKAKSRDPELAARKLIEAINSNQEELTARVAQYHKAGRAALRKLMISNSLTHANINGMPSDLSLLVTYRDKQRNSVVPLPPFRKIEQKDFFTGNVHSYEFAFDVMCENDEFAIKRYNSLTFSQNLGRFSPRSSVLRVKFWPEEPLDPEEIEEFKNYGGDGLPAIYDTYGNMGWIELIFAREKSVLSLTDKLFKVLRGKRDALIDVHGLEYVIDAGSTEEEAIYFVYSFVSRVELMIEQGDLYWFPEGEIKDYIKNPKKIRKEARIDGKLVLQKTKESYQNIHLPVGFVVKIGEDEYLIPIDLKIRHKSAYEREQKSHAAHEFYITRKRREDIVVFSSISELEWQQMEEEGALRITELGVSKPGHWSAYNQVNEALRGAIEPAYMNGSRTPRQEPASYR